MMNVTRDSNGVETSRDTSVQLVLQTSAHLNGQTDAIEMVETTRGSMRPPDTNYFRFASNGDMQLSLGGQTQGVLAGWITLPFASHTPQSFSFDTTTDLVLFTESTHGTFSSSYLHDENITAKSVSLACQVVSFGYDVTTSSSITGTSVSSSVTQLSLAPSIGWIVHSKDLQNTTDGGRGDLSESTLIDYSLK